LEQTREERVSALIEGMRSQMATPSDQIIADFFGVNRSTCQRWKKGTTSIRDKNLEQISTALGCPKPIWEKYENLEINVNTLLQRHCPNWTDYLSRHEEIEQLIKILRKAEISNVARVNQESAAILAAYVSKPEREIQNSEETIQDLIAFALKARRWRLERNGLERLAELASLSSQRMKDIWLGSRPDYRELVKLATVLERNSDELIAIRDRQYGEHDEDISLKNR
jgi:hypothetical protein